MTISPNAMTQPAISWQQAVADDIAHVAQKMQTVSFLDSELIDTAINMILTAGGKRVRPSITILVSRAVEADYEKSIAVAASVELLHTATLVHDDLVDDAPTRRGVPTLHTQLPLGVTVLTGDFLFAQAASLAAEANNVRVIQVFANTLVSICKGEILQAQTRWQVPTMKIYQERIYGKTAALYEAAAISGALLGKVNEDTIQAFAAFGRELGIAFQIVDDALDFMADNQKLGKPAGHDLRQGHINLPAMLYIMKHNITHDEFIEQVTDESSIETIIQAIREDGMAHKSLHIAKEHIDKAIKALDNVKWSPEVDLMKQLARYVTEREF